MNTSVISVEALQKMLEADDNIMILDVRPQEQRDEWLIAGSHYINAYRRLNEGDDTVLNEVEIPDNAMVVTVCAAGRTSQIAVEALRKKGINASSLEGGMKAWNYAWNVAEIQSIDLTVIQVRSVAKGCLSYIIGSQDEAIVVDASLAPAIYLNIATKHNWKIRYVMDTHIHADYISRTIELAAASEAVHLFSSEAKVDYDFTVLNNMDNVSFGAANLLSVFTPGHTPESISYLINDKYLLTGDTLFTDGVGRPDLKADKEQGQIKAAQLFDSLQKISALSKKDLLIFPAHTSSPVNFDKKIIAGSLAQLHIDIPLLSLQKQAFVEQTLQRIPPTPPNYLQIAAINKAGNHEGIELAELEAGANRCAVS